MTKKKHRACHLNLFCIFFSTVFLFSFIPAVMYAQNPRFARKEKSEIRNESRVSEFILSQKNQDPNPVPFAICTDLGGDNGWGNWVALEGYHQYGGSPNPTFFAPIAGNPPAPRFNLTSGAGVDPCSQGTTGPTVPYVCPFPGFGNASIQLGQANTSGLNGGCSSVGLYPPPGGGAAGNGCSERLTTTFTVGKQDVYFTYAYSIFVENPLSGHTASEAPFAQLYMLDANGDTVDCSSQKYVADLAGGVGPGFYAASCAGSVNPPPYGGNGMIVSYKPWTKVGIDLTNYVGQTLTIVIKNSDCALGGHYCYSYWDFACSTLPVTPVPYCPGSSTSISAPAGYLYQWSQNGTLYAGGPNNTSQTIVPFPQPSDTFVVQLSQPLKCDSHITYVVVPSSITPNFNYSTAGSCGNGVVNFTDSSYSASGSTIVTWNWSFPGGTPSSSTQQNPTNISYAPGTYTATLIVASQQGCVDTISMPVVVTTGIPPIAACSTVPVCFNNPSVFTDLSTGNPTVASWDWDFGDGNTSTQQNPSHMYAAAGTFSISLIVTNTNGCKDTTAFVTTINPLPAGNFTSPPVCLGDTTCFTDASLVSSGSINAWSWNFGDPASASNNTASIQNPCHVFSGPGTFTVLLTVTSDSGCQSTKVLPATVNPAPVAGFNLQNACLNSATNFTDGSVPASGDPLSSWDWNFGDGSANSSQQNSLHTYATSGTYTVTLIITSQAGCKDTTTNTVTLYQAPVANFSKPDSGCAPICVNYTDLSTSADGAISTWQWAFPGSVTSISGVKNPQNICYNLPGTYSVSLVVTTQYGCKDSIKLPMIHAFGWPQAAFCVAPTVAPSTEPVFNFCDMWSPDVVSWTWDFGDGDTDAVSTDPVHSYSANATGNDFYSYNVCIRVENQLRCWDTACKVVELIPEFTFYIPNTFTPNSDLYNPTFFGKGRGIKEYHIWLFDRWGNQVWDCYKSDKNTKWDNQGQDGLPSACQWDGIVVEGGLDMGGNGGQRAQEDVYVWKVDLTDIFEVRHTYVGHVNIIR